MIQDGYHDTRWMSGYKMDTGKQDGCYENEKSDARSSGNEIYRAW